MHSFIFMTFLHHLYWHWPERSKVCRGDQLSDSTLCVEVMCSVSILESIRSWKFPRHVEIHTRQLFCVAEVNVTPESPQIALVLKASFLYYHHANKASLKWISESNFEAKCNPLVINLQDKICSFALGKGSVLNRCSYWVFEKADLLD